MLLLKCVVCCAYTAKIINILLISSTKKLHCWSLVFVLSNIFDQNIILEVSAIPPCARCALLHGHFHIPLQGLWATLPHTVSIQVLQVDSKALYGED